MTERWDGLSGEDERTDEWTDERTDEFDDEWMDEFEGEWTEDELRFDAELSERLRASFDVVGPSVEAEERMLARLLEAQAARQAQAERQAQAAAEDQAAAEGKAQGADVVVERFELADAPAKEGTQAQGDEGLTLVAGAQRPQRRRTNRWLAVAASLLVVALGAGAVMRLGSMRMGSAGPAQDAKMTSEATGSAEAEASEESFDAGAGAAFANDAAEAAAPESAPESVSEEEQSLDALPAEDDLLASGGALDIEEDPSYEFASNYQLVRLRTGELLKVQEHDGGPALIAPEWVEDLVGEATAFSADDEFDAVPCWVYRLPVSDDGLYVVRYLEGGSYYAARLQAEGE